MLNQERQAQIIEILQAAKSFVAVKTLCSTLYASESSIRRDLKALESRGLVKRSYGGAVFVENHSAIGSFSSRTRQNSDAKKEIAQKAAALIPDGAVVFLDQSSTAFYLADALMERSSIIVVTNNIEILMLLSHSDLQVIASGGYLSSENRNCLIGGDAQSTFRNVYADFAFFSVKAITKAGDVTDCDREEILVRQEMLCHARKKILLCDSGKFAARAPFRQCHITDVDYLICEGDKAKTFAAFADSVILL